MATTVWPAAVRGRLGAFVLAGAFAVGGCGSTVAPSGAAGFGVPTELGGPTAEQGLAMPGDDVGAQPADTHGAAPGRVTGTDLVPGSSGAPDASGDEPGAAGTVRGGVSPVTTAAADGGPVQIGFAVAKNNAETASALGFTAINNGDEKRVVQALVAAANAGGGLAGQRIEPVFHELDPGTNQTSDEMGQQQCAAFTEDARVIAVSTTVIVPTLAQCLSRRGLVGVAGNPQQAYSASELRELPTIATFGLTQRSQASAIVAASVQQGYLQGGPRVGVVTLDATRFRDAVSSTMLPALRASGARIDSDDVFYAPEVKRLSDLSSLTTAMQSAVLRMRSRGGTHVAFLQDAAAPALLFMQQADSQDATFRYALSSPDAPQVLVAQGVPARQLRGAVAAGWDAYLDVPVAKAGPPPAGRAWCNRAFAKLDLARGSNAEWIAFMHCDAFALLLAAGHKASGGISAASLATGLGMVGDIGSANVPAARITSDRRWATAGYRLNRYDEACGCFSYASSTIHRI